MLVIASVVTHLAKVPYSIPIVLFVLAYGFLMTQVIVDSIDQNTQRLYDCINDTRDTKKTKTLK